MPAALYPLADEYVTISRHITMQVTRRLLSMLGMPPDTKIRHKGESTQLYLWNSDTKTMKSIKEFTDGTQFGNGCILDVELKEEISEEGYARNKTEDSHTPPIFHDKDVGTKVSVMYNNRDFEINYVYKTASMEQSNWMKNQIQMLLAQSKRTFLCQLRYYVIPDPRVWDILKAVHTRLQQGAGLKQNLLEWVTDNSHPRSFHVLKNRAGHAKDFAWKEVQTDVHVSYDNTQVPDKDKRDKNPGHELSFTLKFQFEKPYATSVRFPIAVYQQLMPGNLISIPDVGDWRYEPGVTYSGVMGDLMHHALHHYVKDHHYSYTRENGITIPLGDDFVAPPVTYHAPILTCIAPVPDVPASVQEKEIGHLDAYSPQFLYISPSLRRFLKHYPDTVRQVGNGIVYLTTYIDNKMNYLGTKLHPDGLITTDLSMTKRDICRVVMYLATDFRRHYPLFFQRLAKSARLVEELYAQYGILDRYLSLNELVRRIKAEHQTDYRTSIPLEEKLSKQVLKLLWNQYPYANYGIWHRILNHLLFGAPLESRYRPIAGKLALLAKDSITNDDYDENYRVLSLYAEETYDYFLTKFPQYQQPGLDELGYRLFFGQMDELRMKKQLIEKRNVSEYHGGRPEQQYRMQMMKTQVGYHIAAERK